MNEQVKRAILALGALAEMCAELKRQLIKNGFTEKQAVDLVGKWLVATTTLTNNEEDN
jgi:hypothetical protein